MAISQISLVVVLWDDAGFKGRKRTFIDDVPRFHDFGVSAIGIHPGPDFLRQAKPTSSSLKEKITQVTNWYCRLGRHTVI